jgi:N-acetylneuraminic acid mutarotase
MQDCREYSQSGDSWSTKADHPTPTRRCSAGFGIDSNGYIAGGTTSANDTTSGIQDLDRYTPSGDVWLSMSDLPNPTRKSPGGCTMLLSGYVQGGKDYIQDCDEYDSTENQWSNKTDMPAPGRTGATSIALGDNDCYCMGGKSDYNTSIADCDEFHMPAVPWIENLSPSNGQIDVPVDANIEFDVKDDTGVDQNTITVKVGDDFAIVNGVFQAGFTGTITAI